MKNPTIMWTLVRHSAWTAKRDPCFEHAVEADTVEPRHLAGVARVGGLLFQDYGDASEREEAENYPPEVQGLVPRCRGTFKWVGPAKGGGIDVYVPAR